MEYTVLSIKQPWAWLIANGYKTLENRSWKTNFRGEFLIQASQKFDHREWKSALSLMHERGVDEKIIQNMIDNKYKIMSECGGIIGKSSLKTVVLKRDTKYLMHKDAVWYMGECAWILESSSPLPFIPIKGRLGFFKADLDL